MRAEVDSIAPVPDQTATACPAPEREIIPRGAPSADWADLRIVLTSGMNCLPGKGIPVCRSAQSWQLRRTPGTCRIYVVAAGRVDDVRGAAGRPRVEFACVASDPSPARTVAPFVPLGHPFLDLCCRRAVVSPDRRIVPTSHRECPYVTGDLAPGRHNGEVGTIGAGRDRYSLIRAPICADGIHP